MVFGVKICHIGGGNMKNKSYFSQIMLLVIVSVICVILTICIALIAGSHSSNLFNFENLNFSNMIPILIIGGFLSCIIVGITALFVSRAVFTKVKDYLSNKNGGDKK